MPRNDSTEAVTLQAASASLAAIDALATATARSRDEILGEAIDHYLALNTWQMARIEAGLAAAARGEVLPAESVFAEIAARHGWKL